jgi:hypothetical protein
MMMMMMFGVLGQKKKKKKKKFQRYVRGGAWPALALRGTGRIPRAARDAAVRAVLPRLSVCGAFANTAGGRRYVR